MAGLIKAGSILLLFCVTASMVLSGCERRPEDMVFVPAGEFTMGSSLGEEDERPERRLHLKGFWMDRFEVTEAMYKRFVKETRHPEPPHWTVYGYPKDEEDHPVVFVSLKDAQAYCEWAGKRLPTEEEWEKAARGTDGRLYPWGNEFSQERANTSLSGIVGTTPVGTYEEGESPYGAHDMAGNVWEWTDSDYDEHTKVVRGGSWGLTHRFARTFFRVGYPTETRINNLGFRCAKDE